MMMSTHIWYLNRCCLFLQRSVTT